MQLNETVNQASRDQSGPRISNVVTTTSVVDAWWNAEVERVVQAFAWDVRQPTARVDSAFVAAVDQVDPFAERAGPVGQ